MSARAAMHKSYQQDKDSAISRLIKDEILDIRAQHGMDYKPFGLSYLDMVSTSSDIKRLVRSYLEPDRKFQKWMLNKAIIKRQPEDNGNHYKRFNGINQECWDSFIIFETFLEGRLQIAEQIYQIKQMAKRLLKYEDQEDIDAHELEIVFEINHLLEKRKHVARRLEDKSHLHKFDGLPKLDDLKKIITFNRNWSHWNRPINWE